MINHGVLAFKGHVTLRAFKVKFPLLFVMHSSFMNGKTSSAFAYFVASGKVTCQRVLLFQSGGVPLDGGPHGQVSSLMVPLVKSLDAFCYVFFPSVSILGHLTRCGPVDSGLLK